MVMRPTSLPLSTTRSFSIRCLCRRSFAWSFDVPGGTVTSSFVISARTGWSRFFSKRMSRAVRMPTGRLPLDDGDAADVVLAA